MKLVNELFFSLIFFIIVSACSQNQEMQTQSVPIKIGFLGPLTGSQAVYGQWGREGVEFANASNIKIIYEDSQCDPKVGLSAFTKLTELDNVDGIISSDCSSPTIAYGTVAQQKSIPVIVVAANSPIISNIGDFVFRIRYSSEQDGKALADFANKQGWKNLAILYQDNDAGRGYAAETKKNYQGTIVAEENYVLASASDVRVQLAKIQTRNPDVLVVLSQGDDGAVILKQIKEAGIKSPLLTSGTAFPQSTIAAAGASAEGLYTTVGMYESDQWQKGSEFKEKFNEQTGKNGAYFVALGYDAANLFSQIATTCGKDKTCIRTQLANTKLYEGASGEITFDEKGELITGSLRMRQWRNGSWNVVS